MKQLTVILRDRDLPLRIIFTSDEEADTAYAAICSAVEQQYNGSVSVSNSLGKVVFRVLAIDVASIVALNEADEDLFVQMQVREHRLQRKVAAATSQALTAIDRAP